MTIEKVYLTQGEEEWHNSRKLYANASQAGAIMGVGKYFPRNMAELLAVQRGEATVYQNAAMSRGNELEPIALAKLIEIVGVEFTPAVFRHNRRQASLDGIDFSDEVGAEIKCPVSVDSPLLRIDSLDALRETMPQYFWQVVAQFYAAGLSAMYWFVYHPERESTPVRIARDDVAGYFDAWLAASEEYLRHLDEGTSPETERTDEEWQSAVDLWAIAQDALKTAENLVADARKRLISLGGGKGAGLSVVRVKGRKTTDNAAALKALAPGADLTPFQKESAPTWRITEVKAK
jgi:putative phage-type endonuclease